MQLRYHMYLRFHRYLRYHMYLRYYLQLYAMQFCCIFDVLAFLCTSNHNARKDTGVHLSKMLSNADHILTWKELEDGTALTRHAFETWMKETVAAGSRIEEVIGGIDGQLKARRRAASV